jgi:hypothetical protein
MITAAIYARKSTDQSAVADEAKSVTRQLAHAKEYAARKGWTVADAHVFVDEGSVAPNSRVGQACSGCAQPLSRGHCFRCSLSASNPACRVTRRHVAGLEGTGAGRCPRVCVPR